MSKSILRIYDMYRVSKRSPVLRKNMETYKGKITAAKYHTLYGQTVESGEIYNPHIHATFIPSQFLSTWKGSFAKLRVPTAKHMLYTALRIEKMILDKNTDDKSLKFLEALSARYGVPEALRFILSLSRYIASGEPLSEFEPAADMKAAVHLHYSSLQSIRLSLNSNKMHDMTICYSILPRAKYIFNRHHEGRTSNQMTDYFKNTLPVCSSVKRDLAEKYAEDSSLNNIYGELLQYTYNLTKAYHEFGAYVTIKHFASFNSRYGLPNRLNRDIRSHLAECEDGIVPEHYHTESLISDICSVLSKEEMLHINSADKYRERGRSIRNEQLRAIHDKSNTTSYFD